VKVSPVVPAGFQLIFTVAAVMLTSRNSCWAPATKLGRSLDPDGDLLLASCFRCRQPFQVLLLQQVWLVGSSRAGVTRLSIPGWRVAVEGFDILEELC
jgi:hypothetical protein